MRRDGRLLAGKIDPASLLAHHQAAQLQPVVEGHQPPVEAHQDGKGPGNQLGRKDLPQIFVGAPLLRLHTLDGLPEGGGDNRRDLLKGQAHLPMEIVHNIGDDLGVGLQGTGVAMHLHGAAVGVVGGNLSVVHHGIIQQREGMRAAPPARRIGGIPAMGGEAIPLVFLQAVEPAHVLRIPHPLEHAHVLPAGKHVGAVDAGVDAEHAPGDEFPLVELAVRQLGGQRG